VSAVRSVCARIVRVGLQETFYGNVEAPSTKRFDICQCCSHVFTTEFPGFAPHDSSALQWRRFVGVDIIAAPAGQTLPRELPGSIENYFDKGDLASTGRASRNFVTDASKQRVNRLQPEVSMRHRGRYRSPSTPQRTPWARTRVPNATPPGRFSVIFACLAQTLTSGGIHRMPLA
jgi:hypothetical protein